MVELNNRTRSFLSALDREGCTESFLTVVGGCDEDPVCMFDRLENDLFELNATVARMETIGLFNTSGTASRQQRYCVDCQGCPLAVVNRDGSRDCPVAGLYVHAVSGARVEPVWLGGQIVGTSYEDRYARYCFLNDVLPEPRVSREQQAQQVLERSETALRSIGMTFDDVVRAWFHLDQIAHWYSGFEEVRDRFFRSRGVTDRLVPAGTDVGGANSAGAAIVGNFCAVRPKLGQVRVRSVEPAIDGAGTRPGGAVCRAVELCAPDHRKVFISGAALESAGVDEQVEATMSGLLSLLGSLGMSWADVTRAVGYVRRREDLGAFSRYCTRHSMSSAPAVVIQNELRRSNLLWEIEVDAVRLNAAFGERQAVAEVEEAMDETVRLPSEDLDCADRSLGRTM